MATVGERIVLPRGVDLIKDVLDLRTGRGDLEFLTADFSDAFLNLSIEEAERGNAVILLGENNYAAYRGVPFGLATAPLLWGRVAAWIGRSSQAIHSQWQHRLQIYVDDPILVVKGNTHQRNWLMAQTLALWAGLGAKIALHKVAKGPYVKWIGANYKILPRGVEVAIDQERISKLTEVVDTALQVKGLLKDARSLAGELSWVAGIVPTTRPFVNMIWGAIYGMEAHNLAAKQGKSRGRPRPDGSVLVTMVEMPLTWFRKFLQGEHGGLRRVRLVSDRGHRPQWFVRTDASTTGGGGILLDADGTPHRWWAAPFLSSLLDRVGVKAGIPGRMTVYELLTLLLSIKLWSPYLKKCRIGVVAQLDSESALRVAVKLASSDKVINRLAAELALTLEQWGLEALTGQHWRNVINIEADALSRLQEGYEIPVRLRPLPRDDVCITYEKFELL